MLSRHARTLYLGLAFSVAPLTTAAVDRTGTIDIVKAREGILVINDAQYLVAAGMIVKSNKDKGTRWHRMLRAGQHVRFNVEGEGGRKLGTIKAISIMAAPQNASSG